MRVIETILVDFTNMDGEGRVRLITNGALRDIKAKQIELKEGLELMLDDEDELSAKGLVEFSTFLKIWVARVIGDLIRK